MATTLLVNEPPLQVLPSLAVKIGLNEAIILQQVHYWLNPRLNKNVIEGRHWVRNTYEQWQKQFPFWGEKTIRRAIGNLEKSELLMSFVTREFKKTKYYTINYALLQQFQEALPKDRKSKGLRNHDGNEGFSPSGQNDQIEGAKRADRAGQADPDDQVTMTTFYNTETTTENTPPPLSPPPKEVQGEDDEDEDLLKMIGIWNEVVQTKLSPGNSVHLSSQRAQKLKELKRTVFGNSYEGWRSYCQKIAGNRFLMGGSPSGFKVSFDWALSPTNACKILEGAIYDSHEQPPIKAPEGQGSYSYVPWEEYFRVLETKLKGTPHAEAWMPVCKELAPKIGQLTFKKWFWDIVPLGFFEDTFVIQVEDESHREYIIENHERDLGAAVLKVYPHRSLKAFVIKIRPKEEEIR